MADKFAQLRDELGYHKEVRGMVESRCDEAKKCRRAYVCGGCGFPKPALFMLHDELWSGIADRKEILCLPCAQNRLGRPVTFWDLKDVPLKRECAMYRAVYLNSSPEERLLIDAAAEDYRHES